MGLFATDRTTDFTLDPDATTPQDTLVLRDELDLVQAGRLEGETVMERQATGGLLSVAQWKRLLLRAYTADWRGPSFMADGAPLACTPELINKLNAKDPFVEAAMNHLWELHFRKTPTATKKAKKKTPSTNDSSATSARGSAGVAAPGDATNSP